MKIIKIRISRLFTRLCAIGLGLLGFSAMSCSDKDDNGGLCMYGTPMGEFEIKGMVTTEENKAVEGAKIIVKDVRDDMPVGEHHYFPIVTTDKEGEYEVEFGDFPRDSVKIVCLPENPDLEADSVKVKLEFKGGDSFWDHGKAEKTVNFKLKNKN